MPEQSKDDILRETKVEDIYQDCKDGVITRGMMNKAIRDKAHLRLQDHLSNDGYASTLLDHVIDNAQKAWEVMVNDVIKPEVPNSENAKAIGVLNPVPSMMVLWH